MRLRGGHGGEPGPSAHGEQKAEQKAEQQGSGESAEKQTEQPGSEGPAGTQGPGSSQDRLIINHEENAQVPQAPGNGDNESIHRLRELRKRLWKVTVDVAKARKIRYVVAYCRYQRKLDHDNSLYRNSHATEFDDKLNTILGIRGQQDPRWRYRLNRDQPEHLVREAPEVRTWRLQRMRQRLERDLETFSRATTPRLLRDIYGY